jgi:hypothetical protein
MGSFARALRASPLFFFGIASVVSVGSGVGVRDSLILGGGEGVGEESPPDPKNAT